MAIKCIALGPCRHFLSVYRRSANFPFRGNEMIIKKGHGQVSIYPSLFLTPGDIDVEQRCLMHLAEANFVPLLWFLSCLVSAFLPIGPSVALCLLPSIILFMPSFTSSHFKFIDKMLLPEIELRQPPSFTTALAIVESLFVHRVIGCCRLTCT